MKIGNRKLSDKCGLDQKKIEFEFYGNLELGTYLTKFELIGQEKVESKMYLIKICQAKLR